MLHSLCMQIDRDLGGYSGELPRNAFAELQKVVLLDLDSAVLRFSTSKHCQECLKETEGKG